LPACLLGWSKECNGKDGLLGFIEKKGSRANGLKTNDESVTEEIKGVGYPLPPLRFPIILCNGYVKIKGVGVTPLPSAFSHHPLQFYSV